ncbi:hypothetical protein ACQPYE_05135 [Actinosynnema sp. CA-299493]
MTVEQDVPRPFTPLSAIEAFVVTDVGLRALGKIMRTSAELRADLEGTV